MEYIERQIATLLAGTEIIPMPEGSLEELLAGEHIMFTEEADEGESEVDFIRRAFDDALLDKSVALSTMQCMIIKVSEWDSEMGADVIELFDSYLERWGTAEGSSYTMNWGLYEIPDSMKMSITIVANSPVYQSKIKSKTI